MIRWLWEKNLYVMLKYLISFRNIAIRIVSRVNKIFLPMNERSLRIHEVKFMIKTGPSFSYSGCITKHADCSLNLRQVTTWYHGWWLIINADLETCWAPVNKLDGPLCFDCCYGSVHIFRYNIPSIQHTASHVLAVTWITFHHLIGWFKTSICDFSNGELLMVSFFCRNNRRVCCKWKMNPWIRYKISLEFCQVDIKGPVESQGGGDGADNLTNKTVQVGVCWTLNVQISSTNIIYGFIIHHEGTVRMFQCSVGGKNRVVWFYHRCWDLWCRIDWKFQLRFLSVVYA